MSLCAIFDQGNLMFIAQLAYFPEGGQSSVQMSNDHRIYFLTIE